MNIWAALGAKGEKAQAETQQWIKFRMNQVKNITSSTTQAVLKYNPASLLVKGALNAGNLVVGGTKQALNGADERIPTDKIPNIPASDLVKDAEKQVGKLALEAECLAAATTQVSEVTPQLKAQMEKKDTKGFGVPYRFEIDRIIIHDLKLFAQDYLSANHTKCDQNSSSAIQISLLHMGRRELTIPGKKRGEYRQGVYLDEAVWRLVNKLVAQLFASNKMAMLSLVSMGAASQTTNAVVGVVKGGGSAGIAVAGLGLRAASDGLSAVANTTTGGIKKTGSVIGNFFTGHK